MQNNRAKWGSRWLVREQRLKTGFLLHHSLLVGPVGRITGCVSRVVGGQEGSGVRDRYRWRWRGQGSEARAQGEGREEPAGEVPDHEEETLERNYWEGGM